MSEKILNRLFISLMFASIGIVVMAFFVWNNPRSFDVASGQALSEVHIEQCELGGKRHKVEIKGWGYADGVPYGRFEIYGQLENGRYRKFETFSRARPDVIKKLELDEAYKLTGFESSYRGLSSPYTGRIVIRMLGAQGEVFSANYQCS